MPQEPRMSHWHMEHSAPTPWEYWQAGLVALSTDMVTTGAIPLAAFWFRISKQAGSTFRPGGNEHSHHFKNPIFFVVFIPNRNSVQNIQPSLLPIASTKEAFHLICEAYNQLTQCNSSHQFEGKTFCWKHRQVAVSIFH